MTYRNRYIQTLTIMLTALLVGGSSTLRAQVVIKGSVFGGGNEADVMTTTTVNMSAGTVEGNIYGGGNLGDVGTTTPITGMPIGNYTWAAGTGECHVMLSGGTVGPDTPTEDFPGNVFGGGKGSDYNFWCEKGMVYRTNVSIRKATVKGNVYGGGEIGRVETNTAVTIGPKAENADSIPTIKGSIFGAGKGEKTHGYSALVRGNTEVTVRNGSIVNHNVYGGGEIASVGKYNVDDNGLPYSQANNTSGNCRVNIPGTTQIMGDIFGGGKGVEPVDYDSASPKPGRMDGTSNWETFATKEAYLIYLQTLALATQTEVTIDPGNTESIIQSTKGSVYGGSENGIVQHDTKVTISGNCKIGESDGSGNVSINSSGNVFGGGKGIAGNEGAGQVSGNATVIINSGTLLGSVYGGGVLGATRGNVTVNINGGTVNNNVYGGGALANTNTANWSGYEEVTGLTVGTSSVTDYYEQSFGGIFSKTKDTVAKAAKTYYRPTTATWASSTEKSALNKTRVNLRGGKVVGDAFGGALGDSSHEPIVYGDIRVNLNDSTVTVSPQGSVTMTLKAPTDAGCVVNNVFGCNNAKGTPKGDVLVHVYGTQNSAATHIANQSGDTEEATKPKVKGRYDVNAVYGGGNKAAYDPVDPATNKTQVVIEGCDLTSIDYVYGGGNAAPVPSTDVTVNSCYEIYTLFGGGNGSGDGNPGADVGIIDQAAYAADNTEGKYGPGTALVKLLGGEIGTVYGGSNERGNIVGGATVNVNNESDDCTLKVDNIYGAGNNAKMDGGTDIVMGCMPAGVIEEIYAGARNADVAGNVKLTITSGKFGRVFGGNKHGGKLMGSITVNIEETGGCTEPLIIGELYGGGNLADYSIYGYKNTGTEEAPVWEARVSADDSGTGPTTPYADPKLNVHAFTSIGAIYGGGYRAKMVANPTVDINVVKGCHAATAHAAGTIENIPTEMKNNSGEIEPGTSVNLAYPAHEANKIGAINNVFGGGNLAPIIGNATVNIGTETKTYFKTEPKHFRTNADTPLTPVAEGTFVGLYEATVEGAIIKGSVYGGGNEADITGNTQVNICAKYDTGASEYRRVAPGTAGVTIDKDVFGAGKGIATDATTALVTGNTTIVMMGGEVKRSVYGGGELSQVGGNTTITVNGGTIGTPKDGETRYGGEVYGNVYGGGKGNTTNVRSGLIMGNTNINIGNVVATAGNATYYGVSEGTVVSTPTILHNIYGGGAHGSVGTYTYGSEAANAAINGYTSGGIATITLTSGTIGYDGNNNGMIFGSSRGDIDRPGTIYDNVAWVYDTHVIIGTENDATSGPRIWGSVYGSGENGHTYHNAEVTINSGTIGDPTTYFENRGNVYGGGCGTDKYYADSNNEKHDGEGTLYNHLAGIVNGNATVTINGGSVANNVYGAGSMGKVGGSTFVTINTDGSVGVNGTHDDGNVYGAARGELNLPNDYDYSSVTNTTVTISKGTVKGNVFGGGKAGKVKGNVTVNVTGGQVIKDVYGGGALAHTNTDNWSGTAFTNADNYYEVPGLTTSSFVQGLYTKSGNVYTKVTEKDEMAADGTTYYRHGTTYNTTLNLTGGVIGNAYGGGLGQKNGIDGATSDIEANVYGDVSVMVNGTAFTAEDKSYTKYWYIPTSGTEYVEKTLEKPLSVPTTGRVFGCNNIYGTPKGSVKVSVRRTKRYDAASRQVVNGHEIGKYEIRGVYGGGNLSHYDPATEQKKTSVDIHNCSETSIEKVYGGGNSANVPTTDVTIYGCFDIHYVFGGGNGADVIYRNDRWEENDGANVTGNASVILKGGTISDAFIGSDTKGVVGNNADGQVTSTDGGDCTLKVTNFYGSSKRSDVYGDVHITVSACSDSQVENVYGGSYDAKIHGNITMTITSGILKNVYGGNDRLGSIGGDITINIEEADACQPIIIQNLYGGGYNAPYPGETAQKITNAIGDDGYYVGAVRDDKNNYTGVGFTYADVTSGNITINIKSCTRIDNIYGGGKGANAIVTGNTTVNVNMAKGAWAQRVLPSLTGYTGNAVPNVESGDGYIEKADITDGASVTGLYKLTYSDNTYSYTAATGTALAGVTYYEKVANSTNVIKDNIGTIGNIYGGGDEGSVYGNTSIYIASQNTIDQLVYNPALDDKYENKTFNVLGAHITGSVYGGGNLADVVNGNTKVYIGTADGTNSIAEVASGVTIAGDVFGGGKGNAQLFTCEKAMVGTNNHGYDLDQGNTQVVIGKGTIGGSVYGGGKIARVENNTSVTIGLGPGNSGTKSPVITGNVFGAGQGIKTHGYSALVRGKSSVTIGGDAWVQKSVYGGGEIASVGRFWVKGVDYGVTPPTPPAGTPDGMPYQLKDEDPLHKSGTCEVTIQNYAEIGPDNMEMPTFTGHVFGAGKGFLPESYTYSGTDKPERMQGDNSWDVFATEAKYIEFVETTGMAAETDVTIKDNAFVKGSVYGGSENGHVLKDTYVKIQDDCQVGNGYNTSTGEGVNARYTDWSAESLAECNHWDYGKNIGTTENPKWVYLPYDLYNDSNNDGTPDAASDGHTFYGNVFGGGSGYFPYRKKPNWQKDNDKSDEAGMPVDANGYSDGVWLRSAGAVFGNTRVDITGGHILTSVYGGNEQTDVGKYLNNSLTPESGTGTCIVNMVGGTLGVPRTLKQIHDHPVTCYLFGAGKGDQRINFNTWTNVGNTKVNISGDARIYGSTFGGGEDGHVIGDAVTTIGTVTIDETTVNETGDGVRIGTWGTSYVDGNVFGGGRGFSGDALTAGTVGGNVIVNINGGKMLGSIYGGGRLASVGTHFENPTLANGDPDPLYGQFKEDETGENAKTYGHVTVNISGGTIGSGIAGSAADLEAGYYDMKYSGNVYGGSMGRLRLLNGSINPLWPELAQVKTTAVNISQPTDKTTNITGNVYGGGEFGTVREDATTSITGGIIDGSVYGGGLGSDEYENPTTIEVHWNNATAHYTYTPMQWAGSVGGNTSVSISGGNSTKVKTNVYGGGQLASVGIIDYSDKADDSGPFTYNGNKYSHANIHKHDSQTTDGKTLYGFGLSWPYEFKYVPCKPNTEDVGGKATVTITDVTIGTSGNNNTGYVFGGGKGKVDFKIFDDIAEQRYVEAFCANVRETQVTIGGSSSVRTVYGGGEDGHVYEDAKVTINNGTIERSVFGGGKGTSTYKTTLWVSAPTEQNPNNYTTSDNQDAHSWTAGKVYGNTSITMNDGEVGWFVYGGGNLASVGKGNYSGGADDYSTGGYGELPSASGKLWTTSYTAQNPTKDWAWHYLNSGKSTVTLLGGTVGTETDSDNGADAYIDEDGIPYGSVFGGSRGQAAKSVQQSPRYRYMPDFFLGYVNKTVINIGGTSTTDLAADPGPTIKGSVYGGGQDGHVRNGTEVKIFKGTIEGQGSTNDPAGRSGNVFGAGSGIGRYTDSGAKYLNNSSGSVTCTTLVEVNGGTIERNVYGGGALASVGPYKSGYNEYHAPKDNHKSCSHTQVDIKGGRIKGSVFGASRGPSELFLSTAFLGGVYNPDNSATAAANQYNQDRFATDIWSDVNISGGTIDGNVYGGGEGGRVTESTSVILTGGVIGTASAGGDVYGSGKGTRNLAANVGGDTSVELNPGKTGSDVGCVVRRIFGCNDLNGTPKGHASVHVYATQHRNKKAIHDVSKDATYQKYEKYDNLDNYTPANYTTYTYEGKTLEGLATDVGMVSGDINAYKTAITNAADGDKATKLEEWREAISMKKYDVLAVYGGGNLAPYLPTNINSEVASVVIDGCQLTSIKQVYGGGNAAFVPGTSVRVNEAYEIDEVFGGGNGKDSYQDPRDGLWYQNPGANVGYKDFTHTVTSGSSPGTEASPYYLAVDNDDAVDNDSEIAKTKRAKYKLGSGVATTNVLGGRLHIVYGGSNSRGNISNMVLSVYQESGTCDLVVDHSYGAGKDAQTDAQLVTKMDCVGYMEKIFGGSTNADVYNDIVLTITNGNYGQVFGGNDTDGAVYGSITVNVEEGGCLPIHIDELYAGGYMAPYSKYGYKKDTNGNYERDAVSGKLIPLTSGTDPKNDPTINVISASYIGNIYGGGYQAAVVGSPHVNVNMKEGRVEVKNTGTEENPVWKDNEGKESSEKVTTTIYNSDQVTDEKTYHISDDGLRVDVEKLELTSELETALSTQLSGTGENATDYKKTDGEKTYVYQDITGTFHKISTVLERDRHWAALPLGYINNNIYGGGNEADVIGNTYVEIGTGKTFNQTTGEDETITPARNAANIKGSIYGGGFGATAGVTGNTYVTLANGSVAENVFGGGSLGSVGTFTASDHRNYSFTDEDGNPNGTDDDKNTGVCNVTITGGRVGPETPTTDKGNVFGGGMGSDADYYCEEAMAYGTNVSIINGTVTGNVYGGGKIARLEHNTMVTIGESDPNGTGTSAPEIKGYVFAAGKGLETHGYSALVRGNPSVTVQGKAKVGGSVYGGGEVASVARYQLVNGSPVAVEDDKSGRCKVIVRDYAEIGPDNMQMKKFDASNNPLPPDDKGHVFGAGKGVLPMVYSYADNDHRPKRMLAAGTSISSNSSSEAAGTNNMWEYFGNDADYHAFIETLALSSMADVTIGGHAFVKGSVYGGSENGIVQYDTHVTIEDDCQIGNGDGMNRRYTDDEWAYDGSDNAHSLPECAHWDYVPEEGAPYDPFATSSGTYNYTGDYSVIPEGKQRANSDGGKPTATDGHTYYGNVYGGGSGVIPYAPGLWHRAAGIVRRNTVVDITGGHILTSVYGGNEHTDVGTYTMDSNDEFTVPKSGTGKCTVNMSGGTLGVPRTLTQIAAHPVTCYLFGAGKGDQRIFFNTWTNVREVEVNITDDTRIFGSVFGGGEDGHVIENVKLNVETGKDVTIGTKTYRYPYIGTTGTSYVDGNIFGAGRGYSGEALTAGSVGGNVEVNISDGTMLGSVYGGGRLASVGIPFTSVNNSQYGSFMDDENPIPATSYTAEEASAYNTNHNLTSNDEGYVHEGDEKTPAIPAKPHGHITINITGGTIGNTEEPLTKEHTTGGNVFGGSMGRLELLNGTTPNPIWPQLGQVKTATVNISGTAEIKSNVYGGGELGTVRDKAYVTIGGKRNADGSITTLGGGTVNRDVYGGGYGSKITANNYKAIVEAADENNTTISFGYTPMQWAGCVGIGTEVNICGGRVKKSVYGGGEMASVGVINYIVTKGATSVANNEVEFSRTTTQGNTTYTKYSNIVKHANESNDFTLSWPYEFSYIPGYEGKTNVTITGGRIGLTKAEDDNNPFAANDKDNGDVYGAGKGIAGDYKDYLFCANVGSAEIKIAYPNNNTATPTNYYTTGVDCIAGAVYGGGENGHVMGDAQVKLTNGLIGHALYGGGSGKSKFTSNSLLKLGKTNEYYTREIYSITAGKVFGNTSVEMSGGYVVRNIFGGGTMGSVGKGNYSGGADDYSTGGYGETISGNLWTSSYNPSETNSVKDNAWHFLNSGKCSVKITGGTVGYIDANNTSNSEKDGLPYGNVFGGCRGEAAPNITESPRYLYCPEFFVGYANETEVIIGDETRINDNTYTGPTIFGSVYGGGQDGHVRRDAHVIINKGEIGEPYGTEVLKDKNGNYITDLDSPQWLHRGNVYGAGSGISKYKYDFNYDNDTDDNGQDTNHTVTYHGNSIKEEDYSTSAGSVTRFTTVEIKGGKIHRNVYGGGSLATVGAPKIPVNGVLPPDPYRKDDTADGHGEGKQSQCTVIIGGVGTVFIGTESDYQAHYGGEVYGASRGLSSDNTKIATSVWTKVHIKKGAEILGNVFGGGDAGMVKKDADVIIGEEEEVTP